MAHERFTFWEVVVGFVVPSLKELPLPTLEEFTKDPDYYWGKLREYKTTPYWCHHFGIPKCIIRLFKKWQIIRA